MRGWLGSSLLLVGCYAGAGPDAVPVGSSAEDDAGSPPPAGTSAGASTGPATATTGQSDGGEADPSGTTGPGPGPGDGGDSTADSGSSGGEPEGPTSSFCACSLDNPADDAGSFQRCAVSLADGGGTYYEPPPYTRTPDADDDPGVPTGSVTARVFSDSATYPDTRWDYWIYVPAQYDGSEPAALLVLTDGGVYRRNTNDASYRTPTTLNNLIDEGAMPVTIAVFIDPGESSGQSTRSLEYNTPDDAYATFLLDELLPEALDGYSITDDPARRAIGGRSSGGAAAFIAAWERPDAFGLVYTTLGSFVQLRANDDGEYADRYPPLIMAEPRKPLRVTLLSGSNDLDNQFGNWRDAHMAMTTALDCAGYSYRAGFGESEHGDSSHPRDEFGNDLRWLFALAAGGP